MDGLNGLITQQGACEAALKNLSTVLSGTFSYLDAGAEQTIFELTPTGRVIVRGIFLDFVNMTLNGTIKLYLKIDDTIDRQFDDDRFLVLEQDGIWLNFNSMIESDFKVTYEEDADEGAARDIEYSFGIEERE